MSNLPDPRCLPDRPVSVVLGAGAVRGMAHIGVLEVLREAGFHVRELIGTSVGALIASFHGAIGRDMMWVREAGLGVRSTHLLTWALIRRLPLSTRRRYHRFAGGIPQHIADLEQGSFSAMHHGLTRVGIVSFDLISQRQIVCHSDQPCLSLVDAVRGAVAVPGLFQAWGCENGGVRYKLVDGGTRDRLPVDVVFEPPFQPTQVIAVDISTRMDHRQESLDRLAKLRARFPQVPIDCICVDTLKGRSVVYRHSHSMRFLEAGRRAAVEYLSTTAAGQDLAHGSSPGRYDVAGAAGGWRHETS
jgi:predicted acylesterase/phospholipase RssA